MLLAKVKRDSEAIRAKKRVPPQKWSDNQIEQVKDAKLNRQKLYEALIEPQIKMEEEFLLSARKTENDKYIGISKNGRGWQV